jgi:hypothetical protein
MGMVLLMAWQGVVLARQQAEAEADARAIARAYVVGCLPLEGAALSDIDAALRQGSITYGNPGERTVAVTVTLRPASVLPGVFQPGVASSLAPRATVTMRKEPQC